jgi:hypothetical protein
LNLSTKEIINTILLYTVGMEMQVCIANESLNLVFFSLIPDKLSTQKLQGIEKM